MTEGTSTHGEGLSTRWADALHKRAGFDWLIDWQRVTGDVAPLQLLALSAIVGLALGLTFTSALQTTTDAALHVALVLVAGALLAIVALRPRNPTAPAAMRDRPAADRPVADGENGLLAQMHHELRTPLNAMIGFSEVMLHELHGPLGNARYQEYAAHISESGGRLLKASEDALAVAATMSALLADRRGLRRERLPVATLLQQAWEASAAPGRAIRLGLAACANVHVDCDGQATSQALQHLLCEALARTPPGGAIAASAAVHGERGQHVVITLGPCAAAGSGPYPWGVGSIPPAGAAAGSRPAQQSTTGDCLRLRLACSLLEMQGATVRLCDADQAEGWSVRIAFPVAAAGRSARAGGPRASAAARWPAFPASRGGFPAGAVARASAGSRVAPRA